jgi:Integrase zinc binding domain
MRNYWWPEISKFVLSYADGCDTCQRGKSYPEMPAGKLMPNPIQTGPWIDISIDFITRLPEAQGYDAIFVVCDRFTKQVHIIPTTKETSSLGLACLYCDHVWKLHGLPNTVISDHRPQFATTFMKELNKILGIQTKLSMAYHPQTDGQTEQTNEEPEAALCKACDDMKHYADRMRVHVPKYQVGDKVWLSTKDLHTTQPSRKLMEKQIGPYPISKIISPNVVELKLPPSFKIDVPINVSSL